MSPTMNSSPSLTRRLVRALLMQCPQCGRGRLYLSLLRIRRRCPSCGLRFHREHGYYVGAVYVNVIVSELTLLAVMVIALLLWPHRASDIVMYLLPFAVLLPALLFRHSRSFWLAFDYLVTPPKEVDYPGPDDQDPRTLPPLPEERAGG